MKNVENTIKESEQIDARRMALVSKSLDILKDAVEEEVGEEPEHFEEGDLRSSVWQAVNILENFFKE